MSYFWNQRDMNRWNRYRELSRNAENLHKATLVVSFYFLRLEESQEIYLVTIINSIKTEALWTFKSTCMIVCDMFFLNQWHLSHERFIFDSKKIDNSEQFVRSIEFKMNNDVIDEYYVNKSAIVKKLLKSLQSHARNDETCAHSQYFCSLKTILQKDIHEATIVNNRIKLDGRKLKYLQKKEKRAQSAFSRTEDIDL